MIDKTPPHSLDLEQAVLGGVINDGSLMREVYAKVPAKNHFYDPKHQAIFQALVALHRAEESIDVTTLAAELDKMGELSKRGGRAYLVDLIEAGSYKSNINTHTEKLRDLYELRATINILQETVHSAYEQSDSAASLVATTSQALVPIVTHAEDRGFALLGDFAQDALEVMHNRSGEMTGTPFGYKDLDKLTGGMQKGDFIIIAGRPGMGKTAFMNCVASKQAERKVRVAFFSAETRGREFAIRSLCTDAQVDSMEFKRGTLGKALLKNLNLSWNKFTTWNYWLNDTPEIEINQLISQASLLVEKEKIEIIYVDYLQKLSAVGRFNAPRERIDYIVHALKKLAQQLNVPVVVASQFSRNSANRQNKIPILADLKESGAIEQEADLVLGLYRPEMDIKKKKKDETRVKNLNECYLLKQRNGPAGMKVDFFFNVVYTRFEDMPEEEYPEIPY